VDRVRAIKICCSECERKRAVVQEFHSVAELGSARQTSGNEYKFFR
jgi:hypothetical protein